MANLRSMLDGVGSLLLNTEPDASSNDFVAGQDAVIRRRTSRSGPITNEVMAARIVSMDGNMATVTIQKAGGATERKTVHVKELEPMTRSFKTQSSQFNPAMRGRV
jgi:hypothetical protein